MGHNLYGFYAEDPVAIYHDDLRRITISVGKLTDGDNRGRLFYYIDEACSSPINPGGTWSGLFPDEYSKRKEITITEAYGVVGETASYEAKPGEYRLPPDAVLQITDTAVVIDHSIAWITGRKK